MSEPVNQSMSQAEMNESDTNADAGHSLPAELPPADSASPGETDKQYSDALASLDKLVDKLRGCPPAEKQQLHKDLRALEDMTTKLRKGRVEIVVFGEISTGKSALINALLGENVAAVDVQGGWTKEIWRAEWGGSVYRVPGLEESSLAILDTPGINEVGGAERAELATEAAARADLILFVTDSDLNQIEHSSLQLLSEQNKPIILVLNKVDLYSPEQRERLLEVLRDERLPGILDSENIVMTSADPREHERVIESADGTVRSEWRKPEPDVAALKQRILDVLEKDGLALLTLNAAMYASDKSDRIASFRVKLRARRANEVIISYATVKALAVALNPVPVADMVGGGAVDVAMIVTLSRIYGLELSWKKATGLATAIGASMGWLLAMEVATYWGSSFFKGLTAGWGTVVTAVPQGAAAGYGSYIVGQASKYYFEHGASWGNRSPKAVVQEILKSVDKESVIQIFKDQIRSKLQANKHAEK